MLIVLFDFVQLHVNETSFISFVEDFSEKITFYQFKKDAEHSKLIYFLLCYVFYTEVRMFVW